MKKATIIMAFCISALAVSCMQVNADYDLSRGIDKTFNVGGDISIPVGSTKLLTFGDILPAEDMGLTVDEKGNYSISYSDNLGWSLTVPKFDFTVDTDGTGEMSADIKLPSFSFTTLPPIPFSITNRLKLKQDNLTEDITDVKEINGDIELIISLNLDQNPLIFSHTTLKAGTKYLLPECAHVKNVESDILEMTDSHTLTFKKDMVIPANGINYTVALYIDSIDFTKLPEGQGITSPGHIFIDLPVILSGNVVFSKDDQMADFNETTLCFINKIEQANVDIKEVTATVNIGEDLKFDPIEVNLGNDIVDLKNSKFDFADPRIDIKAKNSFPVDAEANMKIVTSVEGETVSTLALGAKNGSTAIRFPACGNVNYWISAGSACPTDYTAIKADNIGRLFIPFPDRIDVEEMSLKPLNNTITLAPGTEYSIDFDVTLTMPLSFGPELYIPAEVALDEMVELGTVSFSHADITADIYNTIPLGLVISGDFQDSEGNVQKDVDLNINCQVAPGSVEKPTVSPFKLEIKSASLIKSIKGLKLKVALNCSDPSYAGISLNESQGIKLDNVKLHVYDGITIDLNE